MAYYLVEREFPQPVAPEDFLSNARRLEWCRDAYRVLPVRSFLSPDGRRAICVFEAPDAETFETVNEKGGLPAARIHRVTRHDP